VGAAWASVPGRPRITSCAPAMGLLIWRTMPACLCCAESHSNTWWSAMSFHMAPWPPGFIISCSGPVMSHWPSSAEMTGTSGCLQGRGSAGYGSQ
jgi:hypothetical protein